MLLYILFQRKAILLTMSAENAFKNILRKMRQTVNLTIPGRNCSFLYLNILKAFAIQKGLILRLICLLQTKRKLYSGSRTHSLLLDIFHFFVSTYLTIVHSFCFTSGFTTPILIFKTGIPSISFFIFISWHYHLTLSIKSLFKIVLIDFSL